MSAPGRYRSPVTDPRHRTSKRAVALGAIGLTLTGGLVFAFGSREELRFNIERKPALKQRASDARRRSILMEGMVRDQCLRAAPGVAVVPTLKQLSDMRRGVLRPGEFVPPLTEQAGNKTKRNFSSGTSRHVAVEAVAGAVKDTSGLPLGKSAIDPFEAAFKDKLAHGFSVARDKQQTMIATDIRMIRSLIHSTDGTYSVMHKAGSFANVYADIGMDSTYSRPVDYAPGSTTTMTELYPTTTQEAFSDVMFDDTTGHTTC